MDNTPVKHIKIYSLPFLIRLTYSVSVYPPIATFQICPEISQGVLRCLKISLVTLSHLRHSFVLQIYRRPHQIPWHFFSRLLLAVTLTSILRFAGFNLIA